jgi:hypothetical protein
VLREQIAKYRHVFEIACAQVNKIEQSCAHYLNETPQAR